MTEVDTTELRDWGRTLYYEPQGVPSPDSRRLMSAADELDANRAELATLRGQRDAVLKELGNWQATIDSDYMEGTEWERCLRINLPILLAALGVQGDETNG